MKQSNDKSFKLFSKTKKINTIILTSILPVFLITSTAVGIFAYSNAKKTINTEIEQKMNHQLKETIKLHVLMLPIILNVFMKLL